MAIVSLKTSEKIQLGPPAQKAVALILFNKGKGFCAAAMLLRQKKSIDEDVVLHLMCQGLENIQKALLLAKNYEVYWPQMKGALRHNLVKGAEAFSKAYNLKSLTSVEKCELETINLY